MTFCDELYAESLMADEDVIDLEELTQRPAWMADAACKGKTELFFIERGGDTTAAKALCRGCPVSAECLVLANARREGFGIWGGTSARERQRRRQGATTKPARREDRPPIICGCGAQVPRPSRPGAPWRTCAACRALTTAV